jgi:hypothetical protein
MTPIGGESRGLWKLKANTRVSATMLETLLLSVVRTNSHIISTGYVMRRIIVFVQNSKNPDSVSYPSG